MDISSLKAARAILSILKLKDVRPNEMLMAGQVNQQFLVHGGKAADYADGIKYAIERGWLEPLTNNRFRRFVEIERAAQMASVVPLYPDSLKSREKFLAFRGSVDSDGA
jgi:hypothetical protein